MGIVLGFKTVVYHLHHLLGQVVVGLAQVRYLTLGSIHLLLDG